MTEYFITGKRFLIVEDNYINGHIAQEILSGYDAYTEIAPNGRKALDMITSHEAGYYDIILLDIMMPDLSGYEVADRIREIPGCEKDKLTIVALSAGPLNKAKSKSLNGYCRKPFTISELISILK